MISPSPAFLSSFKGGAIGYQFSLASKKTEEIEQGKNYYISAFSKNDQLQIIAQTFKLLSQTYQNVNSSSFLVNFSANFIPLLLAPISLLFASVKHSQYNEIEPNVNKFLSSYHIPIKIPKSLSERSTRVINFIVENSSDFYKIAMVTSNIAIIILGNVYYGGACLSVLAFQYVDDHNYLPAKVSLFMENYMPIISDIGILIGGGSLIMQFFAGLSLIQRVSLTFKEKLQEQEDDLIRKAISYFIEKIPEEDKFELETSFKKIFGTNHIINPSLREIQTGIRTPINLSFEAINKVLESEFTDFTIEPCHCLQNTKDLFKLPHNNDFDQFMDIYNKLNISGKILIKKLLDDDQFKAYCLNLYPMNKSELTQEEHLKNCLKKLAKEAKLSQEGFAKKWVTDHLMILINVLKGKAKPKGTQAETNDSITNCLFILAYILKLDLKNRQQQVEAEDILTKLAVEAGDYCAAGIKRASSELLDGILVQEINLISDNQFDLLDLKIKARLQNIRKLIIQKYYSAITTDFPSAVKSDIHGMDLFKIYLSFGFYPISKNERANINFSNLLVWEQYRLPRIGMYHEYLSIFSNQPISDNLNYSSHLVPKFSINEIFKDVGQLNLSNYLRYLIENNPNLTDENKETLINNWLDNPDNLSQEVLDRKYNFLLLNMMGILKLQEENN